MSESVQTLRTPEVFYVFDEAGKMSLCDQTWFESAWQRESGCGPSVASGILFYLYRTNRIRLPIEVECKSDCIALMESVWKHVTPTSHGIDTLERFCNGVHDYIHSIGYELACRSLQIPKAREARPSIHEAVRFLDSGIQHDSPIAFLNLSSGRVRKLESWHWVTIVALKTDPVSRHHFAQAFDGASSVWIDLGLWLTSSALGGGFVYFMKEE